MDKNTRKTIHVGINYLVSPNPRSNDFEYRVDFQRQLNEYGFKFSEIKTLDNGFLLIGKTPTPIEITIANIAPHIGQFLIVAPNISGCSFDEITSEMDDIAIVFSKLSSNFQIVACDLTIRDLFDSTNDHAFQDIWEKRLKQTKDDLSYFKRPVLGGGVRFVLPEMKLEDNDDLPFIDIRIESYFEQINKIFIETVYKWEITQLHDQEIKPSEKLSEADRFIDNQIVSFLTEG